MNFRHRLTLKNSGESILRFISTFAVAETRKVVTESPLPRQYRIAPDLRRCCWYVIISIPALASVYFGITRLAQGQDARSIAEAAPILGVAALVTIVAMISGLRWKLCIDSAGIVRSDFSGDAWTWDDLASGRIHKRHSTLIDPARTWWRRKLSLGYLAANDIQEVLRIVNGHYRLPSSTAIPETVSIRFGIGAVAKFDCFGIHVAHRRTCRHYTWDEVQRVDITRLDPLRQDFSELVIVLPDREIERGISPHEFGAKPPGLSATIEQVNDFVIQHVAPGKIDITIEGQELTKPAHVVRKLQKVEEQVRAQSIINRVLIAAMAVLLSFVAVTGGWIGFAVTAGTFLPFVGALMAFGYWSGRREVAQLNELLDTLRHPRS